MRKLAALVLAVLFILPAPVAAAEVTRAQLAEAEAEVRDLSVELEGRLGALEAAMYEEWLSQDRIDSLRTQIADRERPPMIRIPKADGDVVNLSTCVRRLTTCSVPWRERSGDQVNTVCR